MATPSPQDKYLQLQAILKDTGKLAIAYSGGVDSVFLLKAAVEAKEADKVVAITLRAENFPARELGEAKDFARSLGVKHVVVDCDMFAIPGFVENSPERCYHCKKALFSIAASVAATHGCAVVADGANMDDKGDYRPGSRATKELGVVSPLQQADLSKAEIRELLHDMNIVFWDKPSFACLASRIPYGDHITPDALHRIEQAEQFFLELGFKNIRVRQHGDLARIEVEAAERSRFFEENLWETVSTELRRLGYVYSALDLQGYRVGSLNAVLPAATAQS